MYTVTSRHGTVMIVITGELDISSHASLQAVVSGALATRPTAIELNLSELTVLDTAGIDALIDARNRARSAGVHFRITEPHGIVRQILEVTHADRHMPIVWAET